MSNNIYTVKPSYLFGATLAAGSLLIWVSGTNISFNVAVMIAVMAFYIFFIYKNKNLSISKEQKADSCYYLGFILTLIAMINTLITLDVENIGSIFNTVVRDFGLALVTTIVGLVARIIWLQLESSNAFDGEETIREKLIAEAQELETQTQRITGAFTTLAVDAERVATPLSKNLNDLSKTKHKDKHLIGTGMNSLNETINFLKISVSLNFKNFLIMPPAYYKYQDKDVINFYSKIIEAVPECQIVLYNFEKLCGYKFSIKCVEELVKKFPKQIVGVKDSSYNLFESLKLENFSVMPGSETKLLKGLECGCSGIITATCNATAQLARKVYDDFNNGNDQSYNQKLIDVRNTFEKYNLISSLHTFFSKNDGIYKNLLPPLSLLNDLEDKDLTQSLKILNFETNSQLAA